MSAPASAATGVRTPTHYRVAEAKSISWGGGMTMFPKGARIDPSGYGGDAGIKKLREQGVKLTPEWE